MQDLEDKPTRKEAILRGLFQKCPNCGQGKIFKSYLKATDHCENCGTQLSHIRTDDFAPWLTIFVLGHILIPLGLTLERSISPPLWVHMALWLPATVIGTLLLLPLAKGIVLGLMWSLGLKGDENH